MALTHNDQTRSLYIQNGGVSVNLWETLGHTGYISTLFFFVCFYQLCFENRIREVTTTRNKDKSRPKGSQGWGKKLLLFISNC